MKITLDLDKLLAQGRITPEQYEEFKRLGEEKAENVALNILLGFGVWATALGALAWFQSALSSLQIGFLLMGLGIYLQLRHLRAWGLLARMLLLVGSVTVAGSILNLSQGSVEGFWGVTFVFLLAAILAKSGLLAALTALALAGTLGAITSYGGATYTLIIQEPTLTILVFSLLGYSSYRGATRVREDYENVALIFARTCLFLVNFGFWVGSLWGDTFGRARLWAPRSNYALPKEIFIIAWAVALIGVGIWALRGQKFWVVNTLAVFGAIHFYTQYFELLGANPFTLMVGGILALLITLGLFRYNRSRTS